MFIGYLKLNIHIPHSRSLKAKRQVINRIKQLVRNRFNVAIAEKPSDKWQLCELSFAYINYTKRCVNDMMQNIESFVRDCNDICILEADKELI